VTVDPETGCWLWTGRLLPNGYGSVMPMRDPSRLAHRLSYRTFVGPIPDGYQVDHVATRGCKYRHCTNPEHLEAVTPRENTLRSGAITAVNAAKTECIHGHPFDEANTYHYRGERACRTCRRLRERKYRADALRPAPT
jgi:hypothetical protein